MKRIVAVVQARLGSNRLAGKALKSLGEKRVLEHVVDRLARSSKLNAICIATTTLERDDPIADLARYRRLTIVRGDEENVLSRFLLAAETLKADCIVRITGDCPCIDPAIVDRVVEAHLQSRADYTSNVWPRSFPRGLDVEVINRKALADAGREAQKESDLEHVTPFIWSQPDRFKLHNVPATPDEYMPELRATLDTFEDYVMLQAVFDLATTPWFSCEELVRLARAHSWLAQINGDVRQKSLGE